jgi:putative endonuclease
MFYYTYLLKNQEDKSWYIGFTSDLKQRIKDHQSGKGGRTTRLKNNWELIYFEGYLDKKDAIGREEFLKSGSGRKFLKKQLTNYLH